MKFHSSVFSRLSSLSFLAVRVWQQVLLATILGLSGQHSLGNDYDQFLVARYDFEDTNNPYVDSSGNNNDPDEFVSGSQPDTFSTDAAVGQYARLFFGDTGFQFDQSASAYPNLSNALSGNFSVTAWVNTSSTVGNDYNNAYYGSPVFFAGSDYNNHCTIPLSITGSKAAFTIVSSDGPGTITLHSATSVNDGNYHFLSVTRQQSSGLMSLYVDGNLEATGTGITNPVITQGYICAACGGPNLFTGLVDDLRIYSTNLSAGDVADIKTNSTSANLLAVAIGTPNLPTSTSGDSNWFVETTNTYNGQTYAAQSGSVTNHQTSTLSVTVTGPGTLTFYWSSIADSGGSFDYEFDIDGTYEDDIYDDTAWYQEVDPSTGNPYQIPPGQHILTWTASAGYDEDPTEAAFLDQVSYAAVSIPILTVTDAPQSGAPPLTVQFTSPSTDSYGNTVTNWLWTFGDGATSTAQDPIHVYTNAATYTPSLTAYSTYGSTPLIVSGPGSVSVSVPTLLASASPLSGVLPLTVEFSTPSVDSDGYAVTNWNWNFGDGANSTAQNPSHTYSVPGIYSATLSVVSTYGLDSIIYAYGPITVTNLPNPAFKLLHGFSAGTGNSYITNSDGVGPDGDLVLFGNTLYGDAREGGTNGTGTVFAVNTDGSGFTNIYNLTASNGGLPVGGLVSSGASLFGVGDTVFGLSTNGTGYTNLYTFVFSVFSASGYEAESGLAVVGNILYGTTWYGGTVDQGLLFYVTTNGATSGELHEFSRPSYNQYDYAINYDGIFPSARLISSGGTLYGTTEQGGANGSGTIFSLITNQPGSFNPIHSFAAINISNGTNTEGAFSFSGLVISGNTLYGTALGGGTTGNGTIFAVNTDGSGFTNLYSFKGGSDGSEPQAGLTLSGGVLYGTTSIGGYFNKGTLFSIRTNGLGYNSLYSFTGGADGSSPKSDLLLSGNVLYGTASAGGPSGNGTIFGFVLPTQLNIALAGTNVVLTWAANNVTNTLQSTLKLQTGAVWSAVSPLPVVINGMNTVTNPVTAAPKYYRLAP